MESILFWFFLIRFIPESVRWLLTKGRWDHAKETLRAVAAENKKTLPESVLDELCLEVTNFNEYLDTLKYDDNLRFIKLL